MIDVDALSIQLVRTLRGGRSQRALSRRLRYSTNVVYLWESGRRWPTAANFFWLAHRTGVDVPAALSRFLRDEGPDLPEPWDPATTARLMVHLQGTTSAIELASRVGRSRDAVGRWLRGQTEPRLPDFLRFVEASTTRVLDFVATLCDPQALPAIAVPWQRIQAARVLTREEPWAPAVLLALELAAYRARASYQDAWIAERLALPVDEVARCLALLADAGQIRRVKGRWQRIEHQSVDTRAPTRSHDLKRWWTGVTKDRLAEAEGVSSFTVCAVSQADFERMQTLQRRYYRELRGLIGASTPSERVVLVNLHTLALDRGEQP